MTVLEKISCYDYHHSLENYAKEHCKGKIIDSYKDDIDDIVCELENLENLFKRVALIKGLIRLNEENEESSDSGYPISIDLREELQRLNKVLKIIESYIE